jgi:hypothetical protein
LDYYHGDTVLNGPVKVAAIALALLVVLLLLDMSFSLVSVGINAPGSGEPSGQSTAGDATAGTGDAGQAGDAASGSGTGDTPAGGSNPLTGTDPSLPAIPTGASTSFGIMWWPLGNHDMNVPSGGLSSTDVPTGADSGMPDVSVPGGDNGDMPTGAGAGSGTGTNPGPTTLDNLPSGIPGYGPGTGSLPFPGSTSRASPPETTGNIDSSQTAGADATAIPDWLIPLVGGMEMIKGTRERPMTARRRYNYPMAPSSPAARRERKQSQLLLILRCRSPKAYPLLSTAR